MASPAVQTEEHKPYVPDNVHMREFTWPAVVVGALLGIVFGASSLYLVLKVGMTVSASIPVAVLSITLFRVFAKVIGRATILENNIVQVTGSAGESIAFGVGVTMPALMLLGTDMDIGRVMVVSILGGLLGILMMIPLRRAFIVKLHGRPGEPGKLLYPEGTACAEVLMTGEKGGTTGKVVFIGFGLAFLHKVLTEGVNFLAETVTIPLKVINRAAQLSGEMASEMLGVGYIIGFRTSAIMMAGAVLGYLVILPTIVMFGDHLQEIVPPGEKLIKDMDIKALRESYLLFIGAGCVAAAGIISMIRTLPLIIRSFQSGISSIRGGSGVKADASMSVPRTEQDLPFSVVLYGSVGLLGLLTAFLLPQVGLVGSLMGAALVLVFGFLFVTVSSRLTGEIGSSSNPISGMTVATLTLTCLIFLAFGMTSTSDRILALCIGGVVCIAASNGGTTSQDLKTGFLVGGTPRLQQYAILIGTLTSALLIGFTLVLLNSAGTIYSADPENFPIVSDAKWNEVSDTEMRGDVSYHKWPWQPKEEGQEASTGGYLLDNDRRVRFLQSHRMKELTEKKEYEGKTYFVWWTSETDFPEGKPRRYLVAEDGQVSFYVDPAIMGKLTERTLPDGTKEKIKRDMECPKTQVMGIIINGVLQGKLNWTMILIGALIAVTLELCGISSLAFAVGVYVDIKFSVPVFIGGLIRLALDRWKARSVAAATVGTSAEARAKAEIQAIKESETSPGVLLASGYIAGGSLAGVLLTFLELSPEAKAKIDFTKWNMGKSWAEFLSKEAATSPILAWFFENSLALAAFGALVAFLLLAGMGKIFKSAPEEAG